MVNNKPFKVLMAGALFTASTFESTYGMEEPPKEVPERTIAYIELKETLWKEWEFVGDRIPERNIPEERMAEIEEAQAVRIAQIEAEQERKRQEELERQRRLEAERIAREKAQAEAEAQRRAQEEAQAQQQKRAQEPPGAVGEFTAYYPYEDAMQGGGITATGHNLYNSIYYEGMRVLAADSSIPFYSIIEFTINGYGTFRGIVLDRGGRINGNKFDVCFPDRESCMAFGRRSGTYKIIRYGRG